MGIPLQLLVEFKVWKGIDNVTTEDARLRPGFVRVLTNSDIDSEGMLHLREGILSKIVSGNCHSLWSDGEDNCFCILDENFVKLNSDWTTTILLHDIGKSRMNFVKVDQRILFSSLSIAGYLEGGVAYAFPLIDHTRVENSHKDRMVGGELIEYFNGRLYATQEDVIYFSDAHNPMVMDLRKNFIPMINGPFTMLKAVVDGLYVSAGERCLFLAGPDPFESVYRSVLDVPAIKGSPAILEGWEFRGEIIGKVIIWSTEDGIYMGLPGGVVRDLTSDHYVVEDATDGCALVKWDNGYQQYIFLGQSPNI